MRRVAQIHAQGQRDLLLQYLLGSAGVQPNGAAGELGWVQVAQDEVGVGDRRQHPAGVIAGWSGHRAGAARPDLQGATRVYPHDTSTAGANFGDVQNGQLDGVTAAFHQTA